MVKKSQTAVLIIVILLIILGGAIFFIIKNNSHNQPNSNNSNNSNTNNGLFNSSSSIVIDYNGVEVNALVDKPASNEVNLLLIFHGTATYDSAVPEATQTMLTNTKNIIKDSNMMIISIAYPEEGLLVGDNIKYAEAALLWAKDKAGTELGVKINKIYLLGHSQGGYLVTRLNTMYETDGAVANAPGPMDLVAFCKGQGKSGPVCSVLAKTYGSVLNNPPPYTDRSLLSFTSGYKSKILFIQGMKDPNKLQLEAWPIFKSKVQQCTDCAQSTFLEVPNSSHGAAFEDSTAIDAINNFLQ